MFCVQSLGELFDWKLFQKIWYSFWKWEKIRPNVTTRLDWMTNQIQILMFFHPALLNCQPIYIVFGLFNVDLVHF